MCHLAESLGLREEARVSGSLLARSLLGFSKGWGVAKSGTTISY